jgi:hypothetical protein
VVVDESDTFAFSRFDFPAAIGPDTSTYVDVPIIAKRVGPATCNSVLACTVNAR